MRFTKLTIMQKTTEPEVHTNAAYSFSKEHKNKDGFLQMNWVATTDENGRRQLCMRWRVDPGTKWNQRSQEQSLARVIPINQAS